MKTKLYFVIARYFRLFARIVLWRWQPKVIAVMGSAGKSSALYLFKSLLSRHSPTRLSYKANSAYGVPLDILGFHCNTYALREWLWFFIVTPFKTLYLLARPPRETNYIVELDVDRPGEMDFFSAFIHPDMVYWVSSFATHTENFDTLAAEQKVSPQQLVAMEYAKLLLQKNTPSLTILNGDSGDIRSTTKKMHGKKFFITAQEGTYSFVDWHIKKATTEFVIYRGKDYTKVTIPFVIPRNFGYTLVALYILAEHYGIAESEVKDVLNTWSPLPGRYSLFAGVNNTALIDSTYNSSFEATSGLLEILRHYPGKRKIAVLGDMRELGSLGKQEHERLAQQIIAHHIHQVILVGPLTKQYMLPYLLAHNIPAERVHHFDNTYQAGIYLKERVIKSGDVILLKASQNTLFFEIIIEMLLANKNDVSKLCRREAIWQKKRDEIKQMFYRNIKV